MLKEQVSPRVQSELFIANRAVAVESSVCVCACARVSVPLVDVEMLCFTFIAFIRPFCHLFLWCRVRRSSEQMDFLSYIGVDG